ncbi:unnamed protein product [Closterium sp. Yama58-4]|nr:unnamed protein product [Closterium sp. Yama58-4]
MSSSHCVLCLWQLVGHHVISPAHMSLSCCVCLWHASLVDKEEPSGEITSLVRPYLMDLGSTNGTFLNGSRIESQRYYELMEKDTVKFGNSSREYVLLHEHSAG